MCRWVCLIFAGRFCCIFYCTSFSSQVAIFGGFTRLFFVVKSFSVLVQTQPGVCECSDAGVWGTCFAVTLYLIHSTQRLYEGLRVSIFTDFRTVGLLTFLSDLAFPVAAGLSLVAHSPEFHQQSGLRMRVKAKLHIIYFDLLSKLLASFDVILRAAT